MGRFGSSRDVPRAPSWLGLVTACTMVACAPASPRPPSSASPRAKVRASPARVSDDRFDFALATSSPRALGDLPSSLAPFVRQCQLGDGALARVAERFARRQSDEAGALDAGELSFALRAEGSPYVWPRAWTLQGSDLESATALERMSAWLRGFDDGGERRCGVALVQSGERGVLAAVAVDALADLEPVEVRRRSGSWVDLNARLLVPASEAKWVVLGPSGAPYGVPTAFDGTHARARFVADRPGAFLVQLLASVAGGPRPVLEARIYADVSPPRSFFGDAAPGEPTTTPAGVDASAALLEMVNRARESEGRAALARDPELERIAEQHARAMREQKRIAHDAGDGDPKSRVDAAGLDVLLAGENVAHAADAIGAHRALWASPSHRENLLESRFDRVGIGTATDPDGSIWVCELFADFVK